MAMIPKHLESLWEVDESVRTPAVTLLTKILGNIVEHPENQKFRDLNFAKIRKKFKDVSVAFIYLFDAGFTENVNGSRLVFHQRNWEMLNAAYSALLKKIENPDFQPPEKIVRAESQPHVIAHRKKEAQHAESLGASPDKQQKKAPDDEKKDGGGKENENENENGDKKGGGDEPTQAEKEEFALQDSQLADSGMTEEDLDLIAQIRAHKDTNVMISSKDMKGMSAAQKKQYIRKKKEEYRQEKAAAQTRRQIGNEKSRREGVKAAQEAQRRRKEYEMAKAARARKKEKEDTRIRKQRIRQKIAEDKERRRKQRDREAREKAEKEAAQAGNQ